MPFIILDRDGVINYESEAYIKSADEWRPIPGSLEAIAQLNRLGFRVLVATNQSGLSRGYFDIEVLDDIHEKMQRALQAVGGYIEEIFFCPHLATDDCLCRKPKPGLLLKMQQKYAFNMATTYFIGDALTDVKAAQQAGLIPILVLSGKETAPHDHQGLVFANLAEAVRYVIAQPREKNDA